MCRVLLTISLVIDNRTEFFTMLLAANKIGAIAIPIYVKTGFDKLKQMIQGYDIQFIAANIKILKKGLKFADEYGIMIKGIVL